MAGSTEGSSALQNDEPNITMTPGGASGDDIPQPQSLGYRQIMQSVNDSMRSDFTSQALTPNGESPESRRSKITQSLRSAENNAGATGSTSALDASAGESNVSSDAAQTANGFVNKVGQKGSQKGGSESGGREGGKIKGGFLKKKGPLMSIIISLLFGGGGMYMTQASLPFTLLDKINDGFDSINVSTNFRSRGLMRAIAKNTDNVADAGSAVTKKNMFGKEKFAPTAKMKKKLATNGISFGKKGTADAGKMIYTGSDGVTKKMTVAEFKAEYDANPEFRKAYSNGTKNWRTSVEEFRDGVFDKLLKRFNISKNRFADYDAKDDPDGSKGMKKMAGDVDASTNGEDITTKTSKPNQEEVDTGQVGADGKPITKTETTGFSEDASETTGGMKGQKASGVADKLGSVKKVVGDLTTIGCGITKAYTAIKVILAAAQLAQIVATAQEMFEGIDKARAGDAASSPINAIGRSLVEQGSEEREVVTSSSVSDNNTNVEYGTETTEKRSAIQSEGLSSLYPGDPINSADESVSSFVPNNAAQDAIDAVQSDIEGEMDEFGKVGDLIESFTDTVVDIADTNIMSYRTCLVADGVLAAVDFTIDAAALLQGLAGLLTGGTTTVAAVLEEALWQGFKIAVGAIISIAVSSLIGYIAPIIANIFTRKLATEFLGEDLGNAVMAGGSAYLSRNHQGGGGLVANESGYMAALTYQDQVNREEAETDRLARSPFDYTSANTFAGQLAVSMTPVMLQADSLGSAVGNFGKVVGNSIKSLLPTASAISVQEKVSTALKQTAENCPELQSMGVVADAYCNPYVTTDFTTIELDDAVNQDGATYDLEADANSPYSIVKKVASYSSDNFEDDVDDVENPKINMDAESPLAKFITFCGQRTSPLGIPDQNIASAIDANQLGTVADAVVGSIPILGDGLTILSSKSVSDYYGYVSGANCVMNESGNADAERSESLGKDPSYDEIKTYSRYIEDQRLAESMGLVEKSAVSIFLEEYYEKYPLDNSTEGILARFSGYTKSQIVAIEDTVEFYNFYLAYDPTHYYPTPAVEEEDPSYTIEDKDFVNDDGMLAIYRSCELDPLRRLNVAAA